MHDLDKQDELARRKALHAGQSFIVQAPAGSGKTELLTQRYLSLLVHVQRAPEEILAVTFTRKAQAEMRQRIIKALNLAKGEPPSEVHLLTTYELAKKVLAQSEEKGWDLLKNPNRLRIMTIDAVCAHLVNRLPILAQFGSNPGLSQQPKPLYTQAIENFILGCQKDKIHKVYLEDLLWHLDNRLDKLEHLLIQLLYRRDQWLAHVYPFSQNPEEGLDYLQLSVQRIIDDTLSKAANAIDEGLKSNLMHFINHAASNGEHLPEKLQGLTEIEVFPLGQADDLGHWQSVCQWLMTDKGTIRKKITKAQGFLAPSAAKSKEAKEALKQTKQSFESILEHLREIELEKTLAPILNLPAPELTEDEHRILRALFELLPLLAAHLKVVFKQKGEVDFIEIAEGALTALGDEDNPTDLALSLDYQINHILIDEFQDTSVIQFQLFEKIIAGWNPGDGRTLFLVGDPQQSIYRFRGAEVGLFLKAKLEGMGPVDLEFLQLRRNFRSEAHICEWSNRIFKDIFPVKADIGLGAVPLSESIAHHEQVDGKISTFAFEDKLQECSYIAKYLDEHRDDGLSKAVLVRARSHLDSLFDMLKALKVPFEATEIETIATSMVIQDLLSLTKAMLDKTHRLAWLSILRAPWCGLAIKDIWQLARHESMPILYENIQNEQLLEHVSQEAQIKLNRLKETLIPFVTQEKRQGFSATIKALWLQLGGPACYQEETQSKASVYFDTLASHSVGGTIDDWDSFEDEVLAQFAMQSTQQAQSGMVHLMTIHKAKGLEFDTVFLPFLEKRTRRADTELLLWQERPHEEGIDLLMAPSKGPDLSDDKLYHYLQGHISQKKRLEDARLLYVGATRAKSNLILSATFDRTEEGDIKPPAASSFMGMLYPIVEKDIIELEPEVIREHAQSEVFNLSKDWLLPDEIRNLIKLRPIEEDEDLNRPEITNNFEPQVGTLVHKILEVIAQDGLDHWQAKDLVSMVPIWRQSLIGLNVVESNLDYALDVVLKAVKSTLESERGQWILQAHHAHHCEYELVYWQKSKMFKSIIDRTFIDEHNRRWIIDYKTVFYSEPNVEDYQAQLNHYAKLFSKIDSRDIYLGLYFPCSGKWWAQQWGKELII